MAKKEKRRVPPVERAHTHDGLWKVVRHYKRFALVDLYRNSSLSHRVIERFVQKLVNGGYLKEMGGDGRKPVIYSLIKDVGVQCPDLKPDGSLRPVSGRQKMWSAMKVLKRFTYQDLSFASAVPQPEAKFYCIMLKKAEYITVVEADINSIKPETYIFNKTKDTGPFAPQIQRDHSIYDRNLAQVVWSNSEAA